MNRAKIYVASQVRHAPMWQDWRAKHMNTIEVTSSWIDMVGKVPATKDNAVWIWTLDHYQIMKSDVIVAYAVDGDVLRGALVEVGIGLALHKQILITGDGNNNSWGSWQNHPLVETARDLDHAANLATRFIAAMYLMNKPTSVVPILDEIHRRNPNWQSHGFDLTLEASPE